MDHLWLFFKQLIFDGGGVEAAITMAGPGHKLHRLYGQVEDNIAGICRYCARAFEVYDKAEERGLRFLAEYEQHPRLRKRVIEGYQIITF